MVRNREDILMGKWARILSGESKDECPQCHKKSLKLQVYMQPGAGMGAKIDRLLGKYKMNSYEEYECESCGFKC